MRIFPSLLLLVTLGACAHAPADNQLEISSPQPVPPASIGQESREQDFQPASRRDIGSNPMRTTRKVVEYPDADLAAGSMIIDTPNHQLYYGLGGGKALRYGIG